MSIRILHLVLAALVAVTFSSCASALNSINQTAGRALNAVTRTIMR